MRSIYLWSFSLIQISVFKLCSGQELSIKKIQMTITQKLWEQELRFLRTALLLNEIYLPIKFQLDTFRRSRVTERTRIKYKKIQRAITQQLWQQELRFLRTALLLNEIYLHMKFQLDTFSHSRITERTRKSGRTHARTHGRTHGRTHARTHTDSYVSLSASGLDKNHYPATWIYTQPIS